MTSYLPGSPCWAQLNTSDLDAAKRFYGELFGWAAETDPDPQYGGYTTLSLDGSPAAAVSPLMNPQQPVMWLLSFNSTDVDAGAAAAQAAGAQVWMGPMDVGDLGRWVLLSDPTGAPFSLWQAKQFGGFGVMDEPNAFGWIDLASRDAGAAVNFYKDVLDWQVWPDDFYPMVGQADKMFGGAMTMGDEVPAEVPSHWNPYFVVTDVDATASMATKLGGQVVHGPVDMEGGLRLALLSDPQGATFGVFRPATGS